MAIECGGISNTMKCRYCGEVISQTAAYCDSCGKPQANAGTEMIPASPGSLKSLSDQTTSDRQHRISSIVTQKTLEGYLVVDRNDRDCYVVLSKPAQAVNHVLHAIVTVFACGLWAPVWLIIALSRKKEERLVISIDHFGNVSYQRNYVS